MITRRQFATTLTAASYARIYGANSRPGVALIGSGRRGRDVMRAFLETKRCDLTSICDVYDEQRRRAAQAGLKAAETSAFEESLSRRDVDAVLIATPDHLHLDQAVEALRLGKHVFLEKPALHQFEEFPALRRAAQISGRVLQAGQQQRSGKHYQRAKETILDAGKLGHIVFVRAAWSNFPWQAREIKPQPKPAGLDWLRFLGSAPYVDYDWIRYDSWRYFPDYGGGVLADIFTHWADVAQWFMNDARPLNAVVTGGAYRLKDGRANPDTVNAIVQYRDWNLTFESTVLPVRDDRPALQVIGTNGTLDIARSDYVFRPHQGEPEIVKSEGSLEVAHAANFLDAIEGKAPVTAPLRVAFESCLPQLLARRAYWSRKRVRYDQEKQEFFPE